jgi:uncharacterized zinc-type alcohol dehydrogenase-like protein
MTSSTHSRVAAYAAQQAGTPLAPFDYEPAPLGLHDVEIAISHCGICHSDLHLIDNDWMTSESPLVPGHEIVGTVAKKGALIRHVELGARVGVGWQRGSCLQCEWCERGDENLCANAVETCIGRPGGFADRI